MPNTKVVGIIFPYILTPIPNLYDHSFPRYGQITFLTFRRPTTLTFDLKLFSVCLFVCLFVCLCVCPCFHKISKCNISAISQPIIMKLGIHITYGYTVTDKYFQNFRSKVKVIGHETCFREISICNISAISQPIIMKFDMHIPV